MADPYTLMILWVGLSLAGVIATVALAVQPGLGGRMRHGSPREVFRPWPSLSSAAQAVPEG